MNCNHGISIDFPTCDIVDVNYCGVEVPVNNIIFVNELPQIGDRDQLYVCGRSIYRWDNENLLFVPIAGEAFIEYYFNNPLTTIVFDGGDSDVTLAVLDDTILL
jgi:hypothetical protein